MAERFSIYAGPPIAAALAGYEDNRSGRLNQVASAYMVIVDALKPDFSVSEWCAVCDGLNSYPLDDRQSRRFAWASIADDPSLGEKWGVDHASLVDKVRGLSEAQLIAMREIFERAWAGMTAGLTAEAAIRQATQPHQPA